MKRKNVRLFLVGLLLVSLMLSYGLVSSLAAEYPTKPIKLIINFGCGGTTDLITRMVVRKIEKEISQPIICKNVAGAGGTIGVATVARSKPDGYTIGTCNLPSLCIVPQMRKITYDPLEDFTHIGVILPYEYVFAVREDAPWDTWKEFVNYVKENPGMVTYGTCGTGTTDHLITARIGIYEGFEWVHVPFSKLGTSLPALLGGHVTIINEALPELVSSIKAGKLKVLLVASKRHIPIAPDVPTMLEEGYPFYQASCSSILAPKGIPESAKEYLERIFKKAVEDPELKKEALKIGARPEWISGEEYSKMVRKFYVEWGETLEEMGMLKQ